MEAQYQDLAANPSLRRLINDSRAAIFHLGFFLGFLAYEIGRRDWKNTTLISTVGLLNGIGWALCQNWKWANHMWPDAHFNFWRCWESSGGISIGIAYGVAYYLVNRPMSAQERETCPAPEPNLERFGAFLGLLLGLGLSIRNGLKGWANIYIGNEDYWSDVLWLIIGPLMLLALVGIILWIVRRPFDGREGDRFPQAYAMIWLTLIVQNVLAQLVTGPLSNLNELEFNIYYIVLFIVTAFIVRHYHRLRRESEAAAVPAFRQAS
jgi:MFS family permease